MYLRYHLPWKQYTDRRTTGYQKSSLILIFQLRLANTNNFCNMQYIYVFFCQRFTRFPSYDKTAIFRKIQNEIIDFLLQILKAKAFFILLFLGKLVESNQALVSLFVAWFGIPELCKIQSRDLFTSALTKPFTKSYDKQDQILESSIKLFFHKKHYRRTNLPWTFAIQTHLNSRLSARRVLSPSLATSESRMKGLLPEIHWTCSIWLRDSALFL